MRKFLSLLISVCIILTSIMIILPVSLPKEQAIAAENPAAPAALTYAGTFLRSSLTLSIGDSVTIAYGGVPAGTTVTYSSSHPEIAYVYSYGSVSARHVGIAEITCNVTYSGGTETFICMIYVMLDDGVYKLQNEYSSMYIDTSYDGSEIYDGTQISQIDHSVNGLSTLWYIKYVSQGNYIISPYVQQTMALRYGEDFVYDGNTYVIDSDRVLLWSKPSNISITSNVIFLWKIQYDSSSGAYSIMPNTPPIDLDDPDDPEDDGMYTDGNSIGLAYNLSNNGTYLYLTYYTGADTQLWDIIEVTNPASGINIFNKKVG